MKLSKLIKNGKPTITEYKGAISDLTEEDINRMVDSYNNPKKQTHFCSQSEYDLIMKERTKRNKWYFLRMKERRDKLGIFF